MGPKNSLKITSIFISVAAFIASPFVELAFRGNVKFGEGAQSVSIAVGIAFFVLASWLELFSIKNEIDRSREAIEAIFKNRLDCVDEGDVDTALSKLGDRFRRATRISNVYVPHADRPNAFHHLLSESRVARINSFLSASKDNAYSEIVSRDVYLKVGKEYEKKIKDNGKYELMATNISFPTVNFIIFNYVESSEVLFGWGGYINMRSARVYSTTDPQVVQMFSEIYSTLAGVSGNVRLPGTVVYRLTSYSGYWLDVGFRKVGARGAGAEKLEPVNVAILHFYMDEGRRHKRGEARLAVRGLAFGLREGVIGEVVREFSSTSCELDDTMIYASHRSASPGAPGAQDEWFGQSRFNFSSYERTAVMKGTIFSPEQIIDANATAIETISIKMSEELRLMVEKLWPLQGAAINFKALKTLLTPHFGALLRRVTGT